MYSLCCQPVSVQPHIVTSMKSNQGVTLETTITQTPIDINPTVMEQPAHREVSNLINGSRVSVTSTSVPHASTVVSATPNITTTRATLTKAKAHQQTTKNPSQDHNHTNKISLVIALFFGLLFLLAVLVIVGRPWWEFIQRPRYSKVDYLMNGL
ncbi:hypothetical protein QZH41_008897 [Actinostola sp. cb2023]|nr:hypothetical protein QZH41_008897 [Actinostola sp. cb2023]